MPWLTALAGYVAPLFLVLSPVFSYSDQAVSMYRSKSSAGFSLDIPLIMLVASMLRSVCREGLASCGLSANHVSLTEYSTTPAHGSMLPCLSNPSSW